jgi:RNA-directed DNA polymerase
VISLIHKYLNAGVANKGFFEKTEEGVPAGGPLSPLLGNIMLNELDKELEKRGHRFVRFADDVAIFCKSKKGAIRVLANIVPYIEGKLFLKVNQDKTTVSHVSKIKYLGYAFYRRKGKCKFRIHPKSIKKMKDKIRNLTDRNNGWGNEKRKQKLTEYVRGWINYFSLADMKQLMKETDEWLRRRIRAVYWRQWKRVRTRYKMLQRLKLPEWKVHELANSRKGYWRMAHVLNCAITNKLITRLGYISMSDYYLKNL